VKVQLNGYQDLIGILRVFHHSRLKNEGPMSVDVVSAIHFDMDTKCDTSSKIISLAGALSRTIELGRTRAIALSPNQACIATRIPQHPLFPLRAEADVLSLL
jgi:hypothetical protein